MKDFHPAANHSKVILELTRLYNTLENANHFQVLGLADKTYPQEVKRKYLELMKKFHTDFFHDDSASVQKMANAISAAVNKAYNQLKTQEKIYQYAELVKANMEKSEVNEENAKLARVIQAEAAFSEGQNHFKAGNYIQAHLAYKRASELFPDNLEYLLAFGWATWNVSQQKSFTTDEKTLYSKKENYDWQLQGNGAINNVIRRGRKNVENETKLVSRAYLYLGKENILQGSNYLAKSNFAKAIEHDSGNVEAKNQLHLIELREADDKKPQKTFWSRQKK